MNYGSQTKVLAVLLSIAWPVAAATPEISWDALANVKASIKGEQRILDLDPGTAALNGKPATLSGYITPINLGTGTTVTSFLLTGTPGTCPFCFGYGPENFVLVSAAEPVPIDITVDLKLVGRFEVVLDDPTGFYYRLRDARLTK